MLPKYFVPFWRLKRAVSLPAFLSEADQTAVPQPRSSMQGKTASARDQAAAITADAARLSSKGPHPGYGLQERRLQDFIVAAKHDQNMEKMPDLAELRQGRRSVIAKTISAIENSQAMARKITKAIFADTGDATVIGITGPAGAGKSSIIDCIVPELAKESKPAVLAVDPTSHITGGAILGDRMRMTATSDSGAYIRSIASRGARGAVSRSLRSSIRVLDYAGYDPIIIESVGAGQTEVDIAGIADITMVVFNPNTGDSIQAIKAGITEIGDIYLINKSDLRGAAKLYDMIRDHIGGKNAAILKASSKTGKGVQEIVTALRDLSESKRASKRERDDGRLQAELQEIVLNNLADKVDKMQESDAPYKKYLKKVQDGKISPFEAADRITGMMQ